MGSSAAPDRVVLLHGQPGAGAEWRRVVERLSDGVVALAPDRPGYGHNPLPAGGVAANVDWLVGLLEAEPPARAAVIVAHSWSGSVALELARCRPELVRGLVLVGSVGPGAVSRMDHLLAHPLISRANRSRRGWHTFLVEQRALVHELPALVDHLEQVTVATVVVAGTRDRVVPFATAEALVARLPHAELVTERGGGHRLHRTNPEVVAEAVRRLLAGSGSP